MLGSIVPKVYGRNTEKIKVTICLYYRNKKVFVRGSSITIIFISA